MYSIYKIVINIIQKVAFPGKQQVAFEKEVLYPLAGIDPSLSEKYSEVQGLVAQLAHADNLVAQKFLDKEITRDQAVALLSEYLKHENLLLINYYNNKNK